MKKYITYLLAAILFTSCDGFLDVAPKDFVAPSTFYKNEDDLNSALMSTYNTLLEYGLNISVYMAMGTDEGYSRESAPAPQVYYYNFDAANSTINTVWTALYRGIDRANAFLEKADQAECDPVIVNRMKGEALFLRAYYHFLLVAYWGDVPVKLESTKSPEDVHVPRTPAALVYAKVLEDMEASLDMVEDLSTLGFPGKVNKAAVRGILARVCLHAAGRLHDDSYYPKARAWAWSLIESNQYGLNPDYKDFFIQLMQNKYDTGTWNESLFEVEFWGDGSNTAFNQCNGFVSHLGTYFTVDFVGTQGGISNARSRATFQVPPGFYDIFEEGDLRRDWNTYNYSYKSYKTIDKVAVRTEFKFRMIGKYRREYEVNFPIYSWGNSTNFPLLRYSDVLLMFAEADNGVNNGSTSESLEAVNQVRRRAFGLPVSVPSNKDLTAMGKDDLLKYIQDERLRELAFESHRKLDLFRWGNFLTKMNEVHDVIQAIPFLDSNGKRTPECDGISFPGPDYVKRTYANAAEKHLLMPIPESELNVNNAIDSNNSGW